MQGKASGRTVQQLQFFYLASLNYFPERRISSVVTLLAKINFLAWGRESLVPKPLSDLLHLCSWWQAAIFHDSKTVLACETAQFNPFIWWPHTKEKNVIIGRKKCCGRMNPVFNRMCSFKEMFSAEYFKMLLFSYIPCLFLLGIQEQLLWLRSQSRHCWYKRPLLGRKCHLKGSSYALLPDQLFKYLIKTFSLLPFCLLVTFFTVTSEETIYIRNYWSILRFWILALLCLTVMGCL